MSRKSRKLSDEERRLWHWVSSTAVPLPGRTGEPSFEEVMGTAPGQAGSGGKGAGAPPRGGSARPAPEDRAPKPREAASGPWAPPAGEPSGSGWSLDAGTQRKVRRGRLRPEATLDLHGMRQDEARAALHRFVRTSRHRGRRCVLVITGKGLTPSRPDPDLAPFMQPESQGGVLRARLFDWLAEEPLKHQVYWAGAAHPTHGGTGAYYLFLKRFGREA